MLSDLFLQAGKRLFGILDDGLVAFRLAELDQSGIVLDRLFEPAHQLDAAFEILALAHDVLGHLRIVPQGRVFGSDVQFGELLLGVVPVKDASSAVLSTASSHRRE